MRSELLTAFLLRLDPACYTSTASTCNLDDQPDAKLVESDGVCAHCCERLRDKKSDVIGGRSERTA